MRKKRTAGDRKLTVAKAKVKTLTRNEAATVVGGIPRYTAQCGGPAGDGDGEG